MGILDANFVEETNKDIQINQLQREVENLRGYQDWIMEELYGIRKDPHNGQIYRSTEINRANKISELYQDFYGDTPICDTCDGTTGFFLEIDALYNVLKNNKWLLRLLRWLGGRYYKRK